MSIYLKKFETQSAYEAAESSLILPNVSFTVDNNTVHYNPSSPTPPTPTETRVVAKFNVTDTSDETIICDDYSNFSVMEIDGVEQAELVGSYQFDTLGEHTVKYTLTDPTSIGRHAFQDCNGLTSIDIPDSVTSIGSEPFIDCKSLTSIVIPNNVTSIGYGAFWGCLSLTSVTIGSGVSEIGTCAFYDCPSLDATSIAAIEAIDPNAFYCD